MVLRADRWPTVPFEEAVCLDAHITQTEAQVGLGPGCSVRLAHREVLAAVAGRRTPVDFLVLS
jgi:hypothetical protein